MVDEPVTRYLFICTENINRSPTGARIFTEMLEEDGHSVGGLEEKVGKDFYVGSAGIDVNPLNFGECKQYTRQMGEEAHMILAADTEVYNGLRDCFDAPFYKVVNLGILDEYDVERDSHREKLEKKFREEMAIFLPKRKVKKFPQRFVFVCNGNLNRSPTAERIAREGLIKRGHTVGTLKDTKGFDFYVGSAGIFVDDWKDELDSYGARTVQYENEIGDSVDRVYLMGKDVVEPFCSEYDIPFSKLENLGVTDTYRIYENPLDLRLLEKYFENRFRERMPERKK